MATQRLTIKSEEYISLDDFSGGVQRKTTRFISETNQLWSGENVSYATIGAITKKLGYAQRGDSLTSTTSTSSSTSTTTTSTSTSTSTTTSTSTSTS